MKIKSFKKFNEAFDFQDWDNTDISGMGMDAAISNLIEETKELIEKEVEQIHSDKMKKMNDLVGLYSTPNSLKMKQEAAKEIADLWIRRIRMDMNFNNPSNS